MVFTVLILSNNPKMKNKHIVHAHEEAKIYHAYYKPSFNIFRLVKSILSVFISGTSPAAGNVARRK